MVENATDASGSEVSGAVLYRQASESLIGSEDVLSRIMATFRLSAHRVQDAAYTIKGRVKAADSIIKKVERNRAGGNPGYSIGDVKDVVGVRVVSLFLHEMPALTRSVIEALSSFRDDRFEVFASEQITDSRLYAEVHTSDVAKEVYEEILRYLRIIASEGPLAGILVVQARSRPSRYSSVHLNFAAKHFDGEATRVVPTEVQIRTAYEDLWAEVSHGLSYKSRAGREISRREQEHRDGLLNDLKLFLDSCSRTADRIYDVSSGLLPDRAAIPVVRPDPAEVGIDWPAHLPSTPARIVDRLARVHAWVVGLSRSPDVKDSVDAYRTLSLVHADLLEMEEEYGDMDAQIDGGDRKFCYVFNHFKMYVMQRRALALRSVGRDVDAGIEIEKALAVASELAAHFGEDPRILYRISYFFGMKNDRVAAMHYAMRADAAMDDERTRLAPDDIFRLLIQHYHAYQLGLQADHDMRLSQRYKDAAFRKEERLGAILKAFKLTLAAGTGRFANDLPILVHHTPADIDHQTLRCRGNALYYYARYLHQDGSAAAVAEAGATETFVRDSLGELGGAPEEADDPGRAHTCMLVHWVRKERELARAYAGQVLKLLNRGLPWLHHYEYASLLRLEAEMVLDSAMPRS